MSEGEDDLVDGDADGDVVFERGKLDRVEGALVAGGVVALTRVLVAERPALEGDTAAFAAAGENVAAFGNG